MNFTFLRENFDNNGLSSNILVSDSYSNLLYQSIKQNTSNDYLQLLQNQNTSNQYYNYFHDPYAYDEYNLYSPYNTSNFYYPYHHRYFENTNIVPTNATPQLYGKRNCNANLLDFTCHNYLKILILILVGFTILFAFIFIIYIVMSAFAKPTKYEKEIVIETQTIPAPIAKPQNNFFSGWFTSPKKELIETSKNTLPEKIETAKNSETVKIEPQKYTEPDGTLPVEKGFFARFFGNKESKVSKSLPENIEEIKKPDSVKAFNNNKTNLQNTEKPTESFFNRLFSSQSTEKKTNKLPIESSDLKSNDDTIWSTKPSKSISEKDGKILGTEKIDSNKSLFKASNIDSLSDDLISKTSKKTIKSNIPESLFNEIKTPNMFNKVYTNTLPPQITKNKM